MTVYGLYVFDRHCTCTFYANFSGRNPRPGPSTLPNVYRSTAPATAAPATVRRDSLAPNLSLPPWERTGEEEGDTTTTAATTAAGTGTGKEKEDAKGLAFDEEAKLVYGIVFSLRNMVKKLSGRDEDTFHSFSTSSYKLHYLYTSTSTHFVLLTSPMSESLRFVLRQIYVGPFMDYVVRNPMVELDSNVGGKGIDNDAFRAAVERVVVNL